MILTLTGPSASGKTTLVEQLTKKYPNRVKRIVTATSRPPRPGEADGIDYHFLSREEFEKGISDQQFVEHAEFGGNLYGLRRSDVEQALASPKICVLIVEQQGRKALKAMYGNEVHCVYMAISRRKARQRLNKRDGWQKAMARIKADKENGLYDSSGYDCVLVQELSYDEHISKFMEFAESC